MTQPPALTLIEQLDALLPQTQCGQCDHGGCLPYAEAMAAGDDHNKCPPGGQATLKALEQLLNREPLPLRLPDGKQPGIPTIVRIREADCIGCTKCIQACPVDAIIGAKQWMHAVLEDDCTGCELCIAPCPVDCIERVAPPAQWQSPSLEDHHDPAQAIAKANRARQRYRARQQRLAHQQAARQEEKRRRLAQARARHEAPLAPAAKLPRNLNTKALKTAFNMAQKQYREASQALSKAERDGRTDLDALRQRVAAFEQKMERARNAWQLASGQTQDTP